VFFIVREDVGLSIIFMKCLFGFSLTCSFLVCLEVSTVCNVRGFEAFPSMNTADIVSQSLYLSDKKFLNVTAQCTLLFVTYKGSFLYFPFDSCLHPSIIEFRFNQTCIKKRYEWIANKTRSLLLSRNVNYVVCFDSLFNER